MSELRKHVEKLAEEVRKTWPKWKLVIFNPRRPRNGFKR